MSKQRIKRPLPLCLVALLGVAVSFHAWPAAGQKIVRKLEHASDRIEMTVNSSRILTLEQKIPKVQVNNPEVVTVIPISPNQVQVSAKQSGVTQMNLWDASGKIYTVDVIVYGDAQELELALKTLFPHATLRVYRYSNSLVLSGYVDQPQHVEKIIRLAEDYSPKVVNNINVGGVQQILLDVRVLEVSRTKARNMGFDFAEFNSNVSVVSSISGLITEAVVTPGLGSVVSSGSENVAFGLVNNANSFFGFLELLQQRDVMKVLAEPKIVALSGRPASFNVGGEFPVLVPQSLGTISIEYKKFGTQIDFVPLVLGNGNIHLEVRPRVSEIDSTRSVVIQNFTVPGLRVREVDTAVEMKAGQTFALAGLIQTRVETQHRGVPLIGDIPVFGALFRRQSDRVNEVELLIVVTPHFVDALDPHEVPPCGPGQFTKSPTDCDFYLHGSIEAPVTHGPCALGLDCPCNETGYPVHDEATGTPKAQGEEAQESADSVPPVPLARRSAMKGPSGVPREARLAQRPRRPARPANSTTSQRVRTTPSQPARSTTSQPARSTTSQPARSTTSRPATSTTSRVVQSSRRNNRFNYANRTQMQPKPESRSESTPPGMIGPIGYDEVR